MAALFLTGCETLENRSDERFRIEATPGSRLTFRQIHTAETDEGFIVSGKVRARGVAVTGFKNDMTVALVGDDGVIIESRKVQYFPRIMRSRSRLPESHFSARFKKVPPFGTTIILDNED